jgi:hypothetical protein
MKMLRRAKNGYEKNYKLVKSKISSVGAQFGAFI